MSLQSNRAAGARQEAEAAGAEYTVGSSGEMLQE